MKSKDQNAVRGSSRSNRVPSKVVPPALQVDHRHDRVLALRLGPVVHFVFQRSISAVSKLSSSEDQPVPVNTAGTCVRAVLVVDVRFKEFLRGPSAVLLNIFKNSSNFGSAGPMVGRSTGVVSRISEVPVVVHRNAPP